MPVLSRMSVLLSVAVALGAIAPSDLSAQFFSFGQNKIQYRKLDWRILRGPHVDLYYYPAEAELAPAALAYAEASYDTLAVQFGHDVAERVPLIVYASHTDFEQTNILPVHASRGPARRDRLPQAPRLAPVPGQLRRVPPYPPARDGARVPARSA